MAALLALGIFMFYWITLVNGEKFADRGFIEPWIGMWAANIVSGILGVWLTWSVTRDRGGSGRSLQISLPSFGRNKGDTPEDPLTPPLPPLDLATTDPAPDG
jgi:hypothetical protein